MNSPFAKVRISNSGVDISCFDFLDLCRCSYCLSNLNRLSYSDFGSYFLAYKIPDTNFYIDWMPGTLSFWKGCPNASGAQPVLFEEVFEESPERIKEILIYNLDVFAGSIK